MPDPILDRQHFSDLLAQVADAARQIANWRTTERDVDIILGVVRALAKA